MLLDLSRKEYFSTLSELVKITSGKVIINGHDLTDPATDINRFELSRNGFQRFNLFPPLGV